MHALSHYALLNLYTFSEGAHPRPLFVQHGIAQPSAVCTAKLWSFYTAALKAVQYNCFQRAPSSWNCRQTWT